MMRYWFLTLALAAMPAAANAQIRVGDDPGQLRLGEFAGFDAE